MRTDRTMDALPGSPFALKPELPGILEFTGEFGAEVNSFVPFVYWLHEAGLMRDRWVRTYAGMRAFYFFLDARQILEKQEPRRYVWPAQRPTWLPTRDDHASLRSPFEMFPDYRARYRDGLFGTAKPVLVVHNKYSVEWEQRPVNFLPPELLWHVFEELGERFQVVYLRPGILGGEQAGYSGDHQPDLAFGDLEVVRRFPDVWLFDELAREIRPRMDYNELKLRLYAHAWFHLTAQGGNAHLAALFSGGMVTILHRLGQEIRHSYRHGHFAYAAQPAPTYMICRSAEEVMAASSVLRRCVVGGGRVLAPPECAEVISALSPETQCGAERILPDGVAVPAAA
jgi:hypothetical protein